MGDDDLREICGLPDRFRDSGLSWSELVRRSPYHTDRSAITEDRLASFLSDHPEFIEVWLAWSEDKRSTGAFFRRSGSRYELGHVEPGGGFRPSEPFEEPTRPCARFILAECSAAGDVRLG